MSNSEAINYYLASEISKKTIRVIQVVYDETQRNIWNVLSDAAAKAGIPAFKVRTLTTHCMANFSRLVDDTIYPNDERMLSDVKQFYDDIWRDSKKDTKKSTWASFKKKDHVKNRPMGNDLIILSTASTMCNPMLITLLTFDHDFIVFSEEIKQRFNLEILNGWTISC